MAEAKSPKRDRVIYSLRALGREELPARVFVGNTTYALTKRVKHDFFAATAFYVSEDGERVVLKVGRTAPFAGLPLAWVGRWLTRRETRFYNRLSDLPNVPRLLGLVGRNGFVHAYVEGQPLSKTRPIPDGFFLQLQMLMDELHKRNIAYVDTNKPENILQGDDGRPHLIDFQISWDLHELGNNFVNRIWLRRLQKEDAYHILKHKRRMRPDELTDEERAKAEQRSWFIRLHRIVTRPYFFVRRRLFKKLRDSGRVLPEGSK